ncbi:hypothetical protein MPSEU_000154800 [Mayamaea pseudoterrestris]|nr:hypothetical protein MPSEU_000154800 [Mayamaea pseudoterrestris]
MKIFAATTLFLAVDAFQAPAQHRRTVTFLASTTENSNDLAKSISQNDPSSYRNTNGQAAGGAGQRQRSLGGGTQAKESSDERPSPAGLITAKAGKITVQGGSLKTWSYASPQVERIHVVLGTEGRPLDADIALWQGPDNTPHKMRIYVEDGAVRPFHATIETPRGPNTVQIRNIGQLEFPLMAHVLAEDPSTSGSFPASQSTELLNEPMTIQGGALRTYPFDQSVDRVQVLLKTDGRPLNSRIELLQGPNNNKQVVEVYTEDGLERPFYMVIETPGDGNVVRVVNSATVEFPLTAWVEPYSIGSSRAATEPVIGGDDGRYGSNGFIKQW